MLEDGHSQKSKISQSTTSAAESGDCVTVHKQHGLECMQTNEEMEAQCITGGRPAAQAKICFWLSDENSRLSSKPQLWAGEVR